MGYNTTGHKESTVAALTEVVDSREVAGNKILGAILVKKSLVFL